MCDSFESFDKAVTGGGERSSWLSSTDSEDYATAVPSLVGMASLSEVEDFDASTINDLNKAAAGLPMDSSNLSSIAEERNNGQNCTSALSPAKMTGDNLQRSKQSRLYTARHYSIGNVEKIYGLRKGSSPYTSFCADDSTDVYGFIQLDVLNISSMGIDINDPNKKKWKEISRWIKYEQDLEEGADKLGKAHIAPLAFHFIMRLNYIIEKNAIALLDLDEKDMSGIGSRITEVLLATGLIKPEEVSQLMSDLLLKHKLAPDRDKGSFVAKLANTMTESLFDEPSKSIEASPTLGGERRNSTKPKNVLAKLAFSNRSLSFHQKTEAVEIETSAKSPPKFRRSTEELSQRRRRESIQMVLQPSAEATLIMVRGDYKRRKGTFIFVRLQEAVQLPDITMLQVPTRIIAILLAPSGYEDDFVEMGRSFGTLMSNRQFYETVLNASGTKDILTGINEFLHESIVLPPGDWYNHRHLYDLLPQHCLEAKSEIIKKQKLKAAQKIGLENFGDSFAEGNIQETFAVERKDSSRSEVIDPLVRTGKPFGGLINDMKRRYSRYTQDFIDGLNLQCFAATIFLYFASLAHNITFGGLLGQKTNGYIGVTETLIAACGSGILFALLSGQPVVPIAPTAPLLLFDEILYKFLEGYEIEFLPFRVWISFWVLLITIIYTAFEGSVLTRNFTRFTQETFSALISLIFCVEAFSNIFRIYKEHPLRNEYPPNPTTSSLDLDYQFNETVSKEVFKIKNQPNTALLSTFLMFGTFIIAYTLKQMRYSTLLGSRVRNILADFSVPIAIFVMVIVDNNAGGVYTTKIEVPEKFEPTSVDKRGWIISPLGIDRPFNPWVPVLSILPAFLVFILMSCALLICELIISQKEKLDKGCGFHLDVFIAALVNVVSAIFGGPFLSCATLKALAHLNALTVYSKNNPPGIPPSVIEVKQERVSALLMSILIGLSILMAPLLKYVSMSILFGVFLYMGITSLILTQFYERMILFITPTDQHPPVVYVRKVPTWKIHLFTLVQIGSLGVLWTVKSIKAISLTFPFIIMLLIPIRLNLKYIYTESELEALDSSPLKPPPPAEKTEKTS